MAPQSRSGKRLGHHQLHQNHQKDWVKRALETWTSSSIVIPNTILPLDVGEFHAVRDLNAQTPNDINKAIEGIGSRGSLCKGYPQPLGMYCG